MSAPNASDTRSPLISQQRDEGVLGRAGQPGGQATSDTGRSARSGGADDGGTQPAIPDGSNPPLDLIQLSQNLA